MDYHALLTNRRSIRDFQDKPVPLSMLEEIIHDTRFAPTSGNRQPCRFIVIRDKERIKRLSDESKGHLLDDLIENPALPIKQYEARLRDEQFNVFYNAPCLVYLIGPKEIYSLNVDCGLTAAYFMFSATAKGLGTCWIGLGAHVRNPKTLEEIGVTADCRIVAPIIIGYPVAIPDVSERRDPEILKIL